jgi:hypothetical protein
MGSNLKAIQTRRHRETPDYIAKILREVEVKLLKKEIFICAPPRVIDEIIEARIKGKVYLLKRLVRCGKSCRGCPHGPYWYGYYRAKGSFFSFYIGKDLPARFLEAQRINIKLIKGTIDFTKNGSVGQKVE